MICIIQVIHLFRQWDRRGNMVKGIWIKNALAIDKTGEKWFFRTLFLLLFFIFALASYFQVGNSDLTNLLRWMVDPVQSEEVITTGSPGIPQEVIENIYYIIYNFAIRFFALLAIVFSFCMYTTQIVKIPLRKAANYFFSRLFYVIPTLMVYFLLSLLPFISIVAFLFVLPVCVLAPGLMIFEKANPVAAVVNSYRKISGRLAVVLFNLGCLYLIHFLIQFLSAYIFPSGLGGQSLIFGFVMAFYALSMGKMVALLFGQYHLIPQSQRKGENV